MGPRIGGQEPRREGAEASAEPRQPPRQPGGLVLGLGWVVLKASYGGTHPARPPAKGCDPRFEIAF